MRPTVPNHAPKVQRIRVLTRLPQETRAQLQIGEGRGRGSQGPPNINGAWSGTWSAYIPARASTPPQEQCAKLTANITQKGRCGRSWRSSVRFHDGHGVVRPSNVAIRRVAQTIH